MVYHRLFRYVYKRGGYHKRFDYHHFLHYKYHSLFFGSIIQHGRKLWAFDFFIRLKQQLKYREGIDSYWILLISLIKITPSLLLFPLKLGGVIQGVPLAITERKQYIFAVKWVIKLLRDKYKRLTIENVSDALIGAIYNQGLSIEKKKSVYEIAASNRHLIRFFR